MIREEDLFPIGKFQKTHALKGELNAVLDINEDFLDEDYPLIIDLDGIFVPFYTESWRGGGTQVCQQDHIRTKGRRAGFCRGGGYTFP